MVKYIVSFIFIVAATTIFFAWSQNIIDQVKVLQANKTALNDALEKSRELQKLRDDLVSKYNSINQQDLKALKKLLPSYTNNVKIAIEIENMTKKHNLIFKTISVQDISSPPGFSQTQIENLGSATFVINVSGSYKSFNAFLADLEKSLRLMEIENLSFSSGNTDSYEYSLSGITYYHQSDGQE